MPIAAKTQTEYYFGLKWRCYLVSKSITFTDNNDDASLSVGQIHRDIKKWRGQANPLQKISFYQNGKINTHTSLGFVFIQQTNRKAHFVGAKTTIPCAHYDNPILSSEEDWAIVRRRRGSIG